MYFYTVWVSYHFKDNESSYVRWHYMKPVLWELSFSHAEVRCVISAKKGYQYEGLASSKKEQHSKVSFKYFCKYKLTMTNSIQIMHRITVYLYLSVSSILIPGQLSRFWNINFINSQIFISCATITLNKFLHCLLLSKYLVTQCFKSALIHF